MDNLFFKEGAQRAARVNALFTTIAPRYDLINDLQSFGLHRYWKGRLITLARPGPGVCALDLCCGTGDLAFRLAARGSRVVGVDFNQQMLEVARGRLSAASPFFVRGDAQRLPFPDDTFEIVTVGYGLRNLAKWETGLSEMKRVVKPGGRLLVLDFGKPDNSFWRWFYFTYLRLFVPLLGLVFCGSASAYAYILESLKHYPAQHGVAAKMQEQKLTRVQIINFMGGAMTINYGEKRAD